MKIIFSQETTAESPSTATTILSSTSAATSTPETTVDQRTTSMDVSTSITLTSAATERNSGKLWQILIYCTNKSTRLNQTVINKWMVLSISNLEVPITISLRFFGKILVTFFKCGNFSCCQMVLLGGAAVTFWCLQHQTCSEPLWLHFKKHIMGEFGNKVDFPFKGRWSGGVHRD